MALVGAFLLFCAGVMLLAAGWRAYRMHTIESRWVGTSATVKRCWLDVYHPFIRNGRDTLFSLRCRLDYDFGSQDYETQVHSTSGRSQETRWRIEDWVARHRPGAVVTVKVNPSKPGEIALWNEPAVHQFNTAGEALATAMVFGAGGVLLLAVGRRLRVGA